MVSVPIRSSSAVPRNLEIKVRVADLAPARATATRLGARPAGVEVQVDRYYELEGESRLKLRTVPGRPAELIRYRRPESDAVRTSDYEVTLVRDAEARRCLVPKTRPVVTVRKRREVLLLDNVRIHLDSVESLGTFVELEAVVDDAHDEEVAGDRSTTSCVTSASARWIFSARPTRTCCVGDADSASIPPEPKPARETHADRREPQRAADEQRIGHERHPQHDRRNLLHLPPVAERDEADPSEEEAERHRSRVEVECGHARSDPNPPHTPPESS